MVYGSESFQEIKESQQEWGYTHTHQAENTHTKCSPKI